MIVKHNPKSTRPWEVWDDTGLVFATDDKTAAEQFLDRAEIAAKGER